MQLVLSGAICWGAACTSFSMACMLQWRLLAWTLSSLCVCCNCLSVLALTVAGVGAL